MGLGGHFILWPQTLSYTPGLSRFEIISDSTANAISSITSSTSVASAFGDSVASGVGASIVSSAGIANSDSIACFIGDIEIIIIEERIVKMGIVPKTTVQQFYNVQNKGSRSKYDKLLKSRQKMWYFNINKKCYHNINETCFFDGKINNSSYKRKLNETFYIIKSIQ